MSHDGHQQFSLEGGRVHQGGDLEAVQKVQEVGHRPVGSCKHCRVPHGAGAQTGFFLFNIEEVFRISLLMDLSM